MFDYILSCIKERLGIMDDSEWKFKNSGKNSEIKLTNKISEAKPKTTKSNQSRLITTMTSEEFEKANIDDFKEGQIVYISDTDNFFVKYLDNCIPIPSMRSTKNIF